MDISGKTLFFGQWLSAFDFLYQGAGLIAKAYPTANKRPFAIPAISNYQVLVSSPEHIQELAQASEESLPFRKAMNERLFFKYNMGGFTPNEVDPSNDIPKRVFKILARENLSQLSGPFTDRVAEVWTKYFRHGQTVEGTSKVELHDLTCTLIARMNNQLLFGEELATNCNFEMESIKYGPHSSISMEIFRQVPLTLVPLVAKLFLVWSGAMYKAGAAVQYLVNRRIENRKNRIGKDHLDCTNWVITTSHTAQQLMALLFASTHQLHMALAWAIVDLALHTEYIALLRSEI